MMPLLLMTFDLYYQKKYPCCVFFFDNVPDIFSFYNCDITKPIWEVLVYIIKDKDDIDYELVNFLINNNALDKYITYGCLCLKYYFYVRKFQDKKYAT